MTRTPTRIALAASTLACLVGLLPAFASGKDDTPPDAPTAGMTVLAPSAAYPGDCAVVIVENGPSPVEVSLRDESGATRVRATAFALAAPGTTPAAKDRAAEPRPTVVRDVAMLALPSTLAPGAYRLIVVSIADDGEDILSDTPCAVESREFPAETVRLDGTNTAIKKDASPERMAQIEELNGILFRQDGAAPRFSGPYAAPLRSTRRTSRYGERRTYAYSNGTTERTTHFGIDFGVPKGSPVFAAGDGRVVLAKSRITTGWTVVLEHLPGVYSLYYHLDSLSCAEGDSVRIGALIGHSGSTGLSTGPHLHWEFRVNGEAVSPDWFVGRELF